MPKALASPWGLSRCVVRLLASTVNPSSEGDEATLGKPARPEPLHNGEDVLEFLREVHAPFAKYKIKSTMHMAG